jgi:hypothetical protein
MSSMEESKTTHMYLLFSLAFSHTAREAMEKKVASAGSSACNTSDTAGSRCASTAPNPGKQKIRSGVMEALLAVRPSSTVQVSSVLH